MATTPSSAEGAAKSGSVNKGKSSNGRPGDRSVKQSVLDSPATVVDVAAAAGVSRQTVSNAFNAPHRVSPSTLARVQQAVEQLDYHPNAYARKLRTRQSKAVGMRLEPYRGGISGVVLDRFFHAFTAGADKHGYRVLVYTAARAEEELQQIETLAAGQEVGAVILTGTFLGDPRPAELARNKIPFVAFGRPWGHLEDATHSWVDVNGAAGVAAATEDALSVTSGLPVAFLGWPEDGGTGDNRRSGWSWAMEQAGLDTTGLSILSQDDAAHAQAAITDAFRQGVLDGVGAIVCASDLLAIGAQLALRELSENPPLIYGFDNTPTADALSIPSVDQQVEDVADRILELIVAPPTTPERTLVTPTLVRR